MKAPNGFIFSVQLCGGEGEEDAMWSQWHGMLERGVPFTEAAPIPIALSRPQFMSQLYGV